MDINRYQSRMQQLMQLVIHMSAYIIKMIIIAPSTKKTKKTKTNK